MPLGEFRRLERPSLDELVAPDILLRQAQALRLAEQQKQVPVGFRTGANRPLAPQTQANPSAGVIDSLLVFRSRPKIRRQFLRRRGNAVCVSCGARPQAREDPVSPEGELRVVGRGRVGVRQDEAVRGLLVLAGVGLGRERERRCLLAFSGADKGAELYRLVAEADVELRRRAKIRRDEARCRSRD